MTLPERIWQRGDLLLAAAGSLACVRALYLRAAELGKLHQFLPCPLTRADYAAYQAAEHLAARLREAARRPGVGGVVLYASCAEVLTQCDLEQVAEQAGLPVRILLRGPLVARTRNAVAELEQILSTFPRLWGNSPGSAPLPVLPPDFSGVASLLQSWDAYPFLLTAGGCTGCLTLGTTPPPDCVWNIHGLMIWSWPRAARQRQSTELREALRTAAALSAALWGVQFPNCSAWTIPGYRRVWPSGGPGTQVPLHRI
ncbi:hypothetical protein M5E87_06305 [Flavonifractor plautii]|nr:hypothetical protein M5E87_06305 [Flavonifractor plautii]